MCTKGIKGGVKVRPIVKRKKIIGKKLTGQVKEKLARCD
jgi:hypothetical protein